MMVIVAEVIFLFGTVLQDAHSWLSEWVSARFGIQEHVASLESSL